MSQRSESPIPFEDSRRVLLVNPTKFLGNLLLAGGLIQDFHRYCAERGKNLRVVVDESFRGLLAGALPDTDLVYYPRARIAREGSAGGLRAYLGCLGSLRRWRADIAFNIEEDSVSHRLTQLSGARFRLGCSPLRHRRGYHRVLPLEFVNRAAHRRHRWYSFLEVFAAMGMPEGRPAYLRLAPMALDHDGSRGRLAALGVDFSRPQAVLHAGATKEYKKWPPEAFAELAGLLADSGRQPVFIGAGASDRQANARIGELLRDSGRQGQWVDLCDHLNLAQLASFLSGAAVMVGNDSGPFHLAAALGIPGVALFGPTEMDIWRPLGEGSVALKGPEPCAPDCSRHHCRFGYRCLKSITAPLIMEKISRITNN